MRMGKVAIGVAALTAAAAMAAAAPAPAQAQGEWRCIERDTPVDGQICYDGDSYCVSGICATGVGSNVEAVKQFYRDTLDQVPDLPQEVCTPNLFSGPICVTT